MTIVAVAKKIANKLLSRYTRFHFVSSIPKDISMLEIGPFYAPVCVGKKVKYFDILNQEELIKRAKSIDAGIDTNKVPFIEYVSPTGDLSVIKETFDAIISSHAIEHQLDFIDHLQKTSNLLNKGGKYYLIIPDKRYCFDHFNHESTIADILDAYYKKRQKHTLKSVIEHRALTTHNDSQKHWNGKHGAQFNNTAERIKNAIKEFNENAYVDVHAWYFTPQSFAQLISLLNELGYTDYKVNRLHKTSRNNLEFYCVLEKTK